MTPEQIKAKFRANGITTTQWAKDNGFPLYAVYRVLNGQEKGLYGQSHQIAVKLGLKKPATQADSSAA